VNSPALSGLRFSVVGPGRVGASLARWAAASGARLVQVAGRDLAGRARQLAAELGGAAAELDSVTTAGEDFLLIAVPDGALGGVAARLARRPQAEVAFHTAGARDASALDALRAAGSAVGSLHPLRAFPEALARPRPGTFYALDGDAAALALARRLVAAWGGVCAEVPADSRRLYHLAAWLSAGGVVTLLAAAGSIARRLGLPDSAALGYRQLAQGAIEALGGEPDAAARITGPVARGDGVLVLRQLEELGGLAPETLALVRELALETLRQIERARPLDERQSALREALGRRLIP
jgi:predicted short-subunit dehydrogenase-like oxidoreductase (DUF2520 family)